MNKDVYVIIYGAIWAWKFYRSLFHLWVGLCNQLRPTEIENPQLANDLLKAAMFGADKIFAIDAGSKPSIEGDSLLIQQDARARMIKLDPQGTIVFRLKLDQSRNGIVVIKEQLEQHLGAAIKYAAWILDKIDPTQRISHVSMVTAFSESNSVLIRTQAEDDASPNSFRFASVGQKVQPVFLKPSHRPRAALIHEAATLAEDFVTLLKRSAG